MANARKTMQRDDWMSLPVTAAALGETRLSVLQRIVRGDLTAQQMAGRTLVLRKSVDALIAARAEQQDAVA